MDKFLEFLNGFNIQTILALLAIFWWFSRDLKNEMKLIESKLDRQADRTDKLYEMFIDLLKHEKK